MYDDDDDGDEDLYDKCTRENPNPNPTTKEYTTSLGDYPLSSMDFKYNPLETGLCKIEYTAITKYILRLMIHNILRQCQENEISGLYYNICKKATKFRKKTSDPLF